jgi:hypothetical protein
MFDGLRYKISVELSDWYCSTIDLFQNGNTPPSNFAWFYDINVPFSVMKNEYALVLGSNPRYMASTARGVCLPFSLLSELR